MRKLAAVLCTAGIVAGGAITISGCGAEDVAGVDVAKASAVTKAKGTAAVEMNMVMSGLPGLPKPITIKATGVTDLTKPRGTIRMDFGELMKSAGLPASMLGSGDLAMEMRYGSGHLYVKLPDIEQLKSFLGGKSWLSMDLATLGQSFGIDTKSLGGLMNLDPAAQLRTLTASTGLKKVGSETIAGASTTHYKGSYSANDALKALPAAQQQAAKEAIKKLSAIAPAGTTQDAFKQKQDAELWVDKAGVMRQMKVSSKLPSTGGVTGGAFTMTYKLTKFGVPLDVSAPPESDSYTVTAEAIKSLLAAAPVS